MGMPTHSLAGKLWDIKELVPGAEELAGWLLEKEEEFSMAAEFEPVVELLLKKGEHFIKGAALLYALDAELYECIRGLGSELELFYGSSVNSRTFQDRLDVLRRRGAIPKWLQKRTLFHALDYQDPESWENNALGVIGNEVCCSLEPVGSVGVTVTGKITVASSTDLFSSVENGNRVFELRHWTPIPVEEKNHYDFNYTEVLVVPDKVTAVWFTEGNLHKAVRVAKILGCQAIVQVKKPVHLCPNCGANITGMPWCNC